RAEPRLDLDELGGRPMVLFLHPLLLPDGNRDPLATVSRFRAIRPDARQGPVSASSRDVGTPSLVPAEKSRPRASAALTKAAWLQARSFAERASPFRRSSCSGS